MLQLSRVKGHADVESFLGGKGGRVVRYREGQVIFAQGDGAGAVFYIRNGKVKLTVLSPRGREAVIAVLAQGDFVGEGSLANQQVRIATATSVGSTELFVIDVKTMRRWLNQHVQFSDAFITYVVSRTMRVEEDLVDHIFNTAEKRLARILLMLARYGQTARPDVTVPKISQATLADMVGTTRSRVNGFMNKFRRLGFIEYDGELKIHRSLLHILLKD